MQIRTLPFNSHVRAAAVLPKIVFLLITIIRLTCRFGNEFISISLIEKNAKFVFFVRLKKVIMHRTAAILLFNRAHLAMVNPSQQNNKTRADGSKSGTEWLPPSLLINSVEPT